MTGLSTKARRYIVLIISFVLLSGLAAAPRHAVGKWIVLAISGSDATEYQLDKLDLLQEAPKTLGGITPEEAAHFRIKLSFELTSMTEVHANIFQTGPFNKGARFEIVGRTATLILRNERDPNGATALVVTQALEQNRTYYLDVELLDGAFVSARLDGNTMITAYAAPIDVSDVRIGTGFSGERNYNGVLRNVSLTTGHSSARLYTQLRFWRPIAAKSFLAIAALGLLVWAARSRAFTANIANLLVLQRKNRIFGGPWKMVSSSSQSLGADRLLAKAKDTIFDILLRSPTQCFTIVWSSAPDRRIAILIGCLGLGDFTAWTFNKLLLPKAIAPALGLDPASLPLRAPLFEGSAPFTDFTEVDTFPNYVSDVSWAAPPAEQFRIMLKSLIAYEWPALWKSGVLIVLFSLIGLLLHLYGMLRLSDVIHKSSLRYSQRILLFALLILTLFPIHFALDRGNAALHNTGFVILGAAYFLEGAAGAASLTFALAAVSKITPVAFALSFLLARQWRGIGLTVGLTLIGIILPAMFLHGSIGYNLDWMLEGQKAYTQDYAVKPNLGLAYSASLFSAIRFTIIWLQTFRATSFAEASIQAIPLIKSLLLIYSVVMALVGLDLAIQAWRRRITPEILISLLAIYQIMAPHIIADYYLTFLVIPLLVFSYSEQLRSNLVVPILLVLILIPKSYIWMPAAFSPLPYWLSWEVFVNGIAVTVLYSYIRVRYASIVRTAALANYGRRRPSADLADDQRNSLLYPALTSSDTVLH